MSRFLGKRSVPRPRESAALGAALFVASLGLAAAGCRRATPDAAGEQLDATTYGLDRRSVTGKRGAYVFELELAPENPPVGELFEVVTTVREAASGRSITGASFALGARMPEHDHGLSTRPEHSELGAGRYLSRGLRFHMPGRWVLDVRSKLGAVEDTAEVVYHQPPLR